MSSSKQEVRIVLVGDAQVGKTSIITVLVSEIFQPQVAPTIPIVTFPPDATPEKVTIHIVDTSSRPSDYSNTEEEIKIADALCIVYDVSRIETFNRVSTFWLEEIRRLRSKLPTIPIILVGNKIDTRGEEVESNLEEIIKPIMENYKEVETCVECSAKQNKNVQEVFFFAQKAVLYPSSPLFDSVGMQLKNECVAALMRIFKLCDKDKDNALSDHELADFQQHCFGAPLQPKEIEGVKNVVREGAPDGVTERGLTVVGFLYLHHLFIQRGKLDTTWTVLRKFGYGDNLQLRSDYINPNLYLSEDESVELSSYGYEFFTQIFKQYDRDEDGALSTNELVDLFSLAPLGKPHPFGKNFPQNTVTNKDDYITLQGFLALWSMTTLLDYQSTLNYLAYFGCSDVEKAVTKTRNREADIKKRKISRHVFRGYVFGSSASGKTAFLNGLINKEFLESRYEATTSSFSVANSVYIDGNEKYLVLSEFENDRDVYRDEEMMEICDVICLVYDVSDPKSFAHVANIHKELNSKEYKIPIAYFATKTDLNEVKQSFPQNPQDFCRSMSVAPPKQISFKKGVEQEVYNSIIQQIHQNCEYTSSKWPIFVGLGLVTVIGGGIIYWKYKQN